MAVHSLGQLTIDLIMKMGGFVQGWTQAEREADRAQRKIAADAKKRAKEVEEAWDGVKTTIGTALAAGATALVSGAFTQKFIEETVNAQNEQALLASALKATGEQAGYSQAKLNEMAGVMEGLTNFSAGEFNQAQTVLLGFTNIVGNQVPEALKRAADFAQRTGVSLKSAAETMGRALDVPSAGMVSLQRQGFKFSESQIEAAKKLEETGRVAEAQAIVLKALDETYGGAAEAARDTLGGALANLKNTFNSVMTGEDGSVQGLREAINSLANTLASDHVRSAFQTIIGWIADLASAAATAVGHIVTFGQFVGETLAKAAHGSADPIERLTDNISSAQIELKGLNDELARTSKFSSGAGYDSRAELTKRRDDLQKQVDGMVKARADLARAANNVTASSVTLGPDLKPRTVGAIKLDDVNKPKGGKSQAEKDAEAAEKYLQSLRETASARNTLNTFEKLALDIETGKVVMSDKQLEQAKSLALIADERVYTEKQQAENVAYLTSLYDEARTLTEAALTPTEKWVKQVERLNELSATGALDQETYARTVKKYYKDLTEETDSFALNFQKNVQDMIGNTLVQGLSGSFKDIAASFLKMLLQMEAQAAAANFMRLFTGEGSVQASPLGSLLGKAGGWLSGLFGGGRATGGSVAGGSLYRVNELGPELLSYGGSDYLMMGGSGGYVKPVGAADTERRGAGNITVVNQTTGRVDKVEQRQLTRDDVVLIIQEQTPGIMVSQTQNANSAFSRTMQGSFNTTRRR